MMDQHLHHQSVASILPSNASDALDASYYDTSSSSRRVLQERCGNRRDEEIDQPRMRRAYDFLKQSEPQFIANVRHDKYKAVDKENIQLIISDSERLWRHLWSCKEFMKYRQRQPKHLENEPPPGQKGGTTWPDHMEAAFCRALAAYPPIGRCKITPDGDTKLRGRNELIAHFIMVETGEPRGRKQVSSHIQVLKPYVQDDPYGKVPENHVDARNLCLLELKVNNFFLAPKDTDPKEIRRNKYKADRKKKNRYASSHAHGDRHHMSRYPVARYVHHPQQPLPYSSSTLGSNVFRSHYASYEPVMFSMSIQDLGAHRTPRVIHEFTSLRQVAQLSSVTINNFDSLTADYHQLSAYPCEDLLRTQIISAESTIRLVGSKLPDNAELVNQLSLQSTANLDKYRDFRCRVRFYDSGQLLKFKVQNKDVRGNSTGQKFETTEICDRIDYDRHTQQLGNVHFGSDFWAHKLGLSMSELKKANSCLAKAMELRGEEAAKYEDCARGLKVNLVKSFQSLTALQEISATTKFGGKVERLLLICWKFEQCVDESKVGETAWRNVMFNDSAVQTGLTVSGAMPFIKTAVKEESFTHSPWEGNVMDDASASVAAATTLQQAFDPMQAYALPDFSTITMHDMPISASVEEQLAPQMCSDNDFDFTGGHIQLNLGHDLPDTSMDLVSSFHQDDNTMGNTILMYDQAPWHEMQYADPYFSQAQSGGYSAMPTYDEHQETPFSEAGTQQHQDHVINPMHQEQKGFTDTLQHLSSAPEHPQISQQAMTPEEALRQHAYLEEIARSQHLSPQHIDALHEQHHEMQPVQAYAEEHNGEDCGPEQALQSMEFSSQGMTV